MSECNKESSDIREKWSPISVFLAFISIPLIVLIKALFVVTMFEISYKHYQSNGLSLLSGIGLIAIVAILKRDSHRPFCHSKCHFNQILQDAVYIAIIGLSFQTCAWVAEYV